LPPDPAVAGDDWRSRWAERLTQTPAFLEPWLSHQLRDDYWRHGSVCEDYAAIEVPVYAVGGWSDGYTDAIPRLLAGLPGPRKGLIGPWSHAFPHDSVPGPHHTDWPGRWVAEPRWPPADAAARARRLFPRASGALDLAPGAGEECVHRGEEVAGLDAGALTADGGFGDWPGDQRAEDGRSLSFTSAPLDAPLEILGNPR